MSRSYEQTCVIARALDVLGERWTFLIIRELTLGKRRYGELLENLPGMGTSLLAARLKHLEIHDIVRRSTLAGPGRATSYELTERGEALLPALTGLATWGAGLGEAPDHYADSAMWVVAAMRLAAGESGASFDTITEIVVEKETVWIYGDGERTHVQTGPAPIKAALRLTCDKPTFYRLSKQQRSVQEALSAGDLLLEGDVSTAEKFFSTFHFPQAAA
ncbi:winged helix-turn-helix transcriptional regulator [Streptomyces mirabilis]|uniref:winged helix-turn-helix transcriptional regulator n=1 Tax=Streptomyces mirabilis TaxID=68239 RepID=UPI00368A5D40